MARPGCAAERRDAEMRRDRRFRPSLEGAPRLEDRIAPAGGSILTTIGARYIAAFERAYSDFARSFSDAATSILFADGAGGVAANRPAFNAQVEQAAQALVADLLPILALSPAAVNRLTPRVVDAIVGPDGSLVQQLEAIADPGADSTDSAGAFGGDSAAIIQASLGEQIARLQAFFDPNAPFRQSAPRGAGLTARQAIARSYQAQIANAFSGTINGFGQSAATTLFADGEVSKLEASRPNFDQQVAGGVGAIAANLTSMLGLFPALGARTIPYVQGRLLGSNGGLLGSLQALNTPTDLSASAQEFGSLSSSALNTAYIDVANAVATAFGGSRATTATGGFGDVALGLATDTGTPGGTGSGSSTGTGSGSGAFDPFTGGFVSRFASGFDASRLTFPATPLGNTFGNAGFNGFGLFLPYGSALDGGFGNTSGAVNAGLGLGFGGGLGTLYGVGTQNGFFNGYGGTGTISGTTGGLGGGTGLGSTGNATGGSGITSGFDTGFFGNGAFGSRYSGGSNGGFGGI